MRQRKKAPNANNAITSMLSNADANGPISPKCESNAAIPSPAAMPARGANQRFPAGWGAAGVVCDCPGLAAVSCAGAFGAGSDCCRFTLEDWRPKLLPPPRRLASASCTTSAKLRMTASNVAVPANHWHKIWREVVMGSL